MTRKLGSKLGSTGTRIPQDPRERQGFFDALQKRIAPHPLFQKTVRERYQQIHGKRVHSGTVSASIRGETTSQPIVEIAFLLLAELEKKSA